MPADLTIALLLLLTFSAAKKQGYEIDGPHEKEYIKGPGVFLRGDPKNFYAMLYTILRYRVKKLM